MRPLYIVAGTILLGVALLFPACKGDPGPTGPQGNTGFPAPACSSPSSKGLTVAGTTFGGDGGGIIWADPITLTTPETATNIALNIASGAVTGQLILSIYTDNGSGVPLHLVYQTPPQNVAVGWDTASIPNVYLPAGNYWLAFLFSNTSNGTYNSSGNYYSATYGWGALPTTFPTGTANTNSQDAIYVSLCP